jgi:hypothetical protein
MNPPLPRLATEPPARREEEKYTIEPSGWISDPTLSSANRGVAMIVTSVRAKHQPAPKVTLNLDSFTISDGNFIALGRPDQFDLCLSNLACLKPVLDARYAGIVP